MSKNLNPDEEEKSQDPKGESDGEDTHGHEAPLIPAEMLARRKFLAKMSVALGAAGGVALGIPAVGFIIAPLFRKETREWRSMGKIEQFKIGETVNVVYEDATPLPWAGVTSKTAAWLRRVNETDFEAFSVNCAHLGCPVRWMPEAKLFMCPCHGGVYYQDGSVAAGPPPHALPQYPVRVRDGQVEVRTDPIPIG
jgi:menaquinol-cytochrome c reductase iron-sulfur subunit